MWGSLGGANGVRSVGELCRRETNSVGSVG